MLPQHTLSISINRPPEVVYDFAWQPEAFMKWASGLAKTLVQAKGKWIAHTPNGPVQVRFTPHNHFGILDHWVVPPTGEETYIGLRVIPNQAGSEVVFTFYRTPEMDDATFEADRETIRADLETLKGIVEGGAISPGYPEAQP
ncbi:hypothetical protein ABAC460_02650 [Asticcacaulis sp. AC460]|uniref:SRPBCC family protein n=1 Tax=Asticcacaulis sp. AC460 TaxID=1282360 RepID=UPI0003C3CDA3|nr:SRPBCC family protein [Asticcacaulis sp. AC460]ESQ92749.1 hypothetical protein ABAC460_02650 [Asticcacaulis sp. AC460]